MTLNQQPAQWTYGGRKFEYVGNVGSTGGSTGDHLHGELRGPDGKNQKDWTNTEAASNVFFQKSDGSIGRLYEPDGKGGFRVNPVAVKTSQFGMRNHPITGTSKMHTGNDYGLAGGTKLFVPRDILTGSFSGFSDPKGYGNAVDIPTKQGVLRFAHLKDPANKLTIGEPAQTTDGTQTASTPASTPTSGEAAKKMDAGTVINLAFNLGKNRDDEKPDLAQTLLKNYIGGLFTQPDLMAQVGKMSNPYANIG